MSEYEKLYLEKSISKLISYEIIIFITVSVASGVGLAFSLVNGIYFLILNELVSSEFINARKGKIRKLK